MHTQYKPHSMFSFIRQIPVKSSLVALNLSKWLISEVGYSETGFFCKFRKSYSSHLFLEDSVHTHEFKVNKTPLVKREEKQPALV